MRFEKFIFSTAETDRTQAFIIIFCHPTIKILRWSQQSACPAAELTKVAPLMVLFSLSLLGHGYGLLKCDQSFHMTIIHKLCYINWVMTFNIFFCAIYFSLRSRLARIWKFCMGSKEWLFKQIFGNGFYI